MRCNASVNVCIKICFYYPAMAGFFIAHALVKLAVSRKVRKGFRQGRKGKGQCSYSPWYQGFPIFKKMQICNEWVEGFPQRVSFIVFTQSTQRFSPGAQREGPVFISSLVSGISYLRKICKFVMNGLRVSRKARKGFRQGRKEVGVGFGWLMVIYQHYGGWRVSGDWFYAKSVKYFSQVRNGVG